MIILHESVYSLSMTQNSGETQCATHQLPECPFVIGRTQGLVGRSILRAGLWQLLFGSLEMASRQTSQIGRQEQQQGAPSRAPSLLWPLLPAPFVLQMLHSTCTSLGSQDPSPGSGHHYSSTQNLSPVVLQTYWPFRPSGDWDLQFLFSGSITDLCPSSASALHPLLSYFPFCPSVSVFSCPRCSWTVQPLLQLFCSWPLCCFCSPAAWLPRACCHCHCIPSAGTTATTSCYFFLWITSSAITTKSKGKHWRETLAGLILEHHRRRYRRVSTSNWLVSLNRLLV